MRQSADTNVNRPGIAGISCREDNMFQTRVGNVPVPNSELLRCRLENPENPAAAIAPGPPGADVLLALLLPGDVSEFTGCCFCKMLHAKTHNWTARHFTTFSESTMTTWPPLMITSTTSASVSSTQCNTFTRWPSPASASRSPYTTTRATATASSSLASHNTKTCIADSRCTTFGSPCIALDMSRNGFRLHRSRCNPRRMATSSTTAPRESLGSQCTTVAVASDAIADSTARPL
mmetsp:Transcript_33978/g.88618  ORF Transcript_33978/g.88618 Transcript_33978/m.88618 type:complete len:234 (+) Transcript_33978:2549-3250(+)